jgi:hypothetical protein
VNYPALRLSRELSGSVYLYPCRAAAFRRQWNGLSERLASRSPSLGTGRLKREHKVFLRKPLAPGYSSSLHDMGWPTLFGPRMRSMRAGKALLILLPMALILAAGPLSPAARAEPLCIVPVKVLVDQKEPTVQQVWEKRYRDRFAAASEILERTCHVRFQVVAVGTWNSDDNARDLLKLMDDFERKVNPAPARLAIGFTGQFRTLVDDKHIGGARGPFRSHVLIREWGRQITDPERLEILVHELGHYLGAVHSPERQSVMRPDVSDRQSRKRDFHISFDARNAAAMSLIAEEMGKRRLVHLAQLSPTTKQRLRETYQSLAAALPSDPAAPRYLAMLDQSLGVTGESSDRMREVIGGARVVVRAVSAAAARNRLLPKKGSGGAGAEARAEGDQLTELYVRQAAAAAKRLPAKVAAPALLVGLGVALDDSPMLPNTAVAGNLWQQIESPSARLARVESLGSPTMRGRRDLARHFAVSAGLAILAGPQNAEEIAVISEMSNSRSGGGFSFADLSADIAGIQFAAAVTNGRIALSRLESRFAVLDHLPETNGLKEGIGWKDFVKEYGFPPDARLTRQRESLRAKAVAMPGNRAALK